jgi:hypothetical protein
VVETDVDFPFLAIPGIRPTSFPLSMILEANDNDLKRNNVFYATVTM